MRLLPLFELALGLLAVGSTFGKTVLYQLPVVNAPTKADGYERMYGFLPVVRGEHYFNADFIQ